MTTLRRDRDTVVKTMTADVDPYFAAMPADAAAVRRYAQALRDAGVTLPDRLSVTDSPAGPEVRHAWIPGPALPELPGTRTAAFLEAVAAIARWTRGLAGTGARLDANLANFVIPAGGSITCIDVLPPLLADHRPPEAGPWEQVLGGLCFDPDVSLCALAGYAARHLMRVMEPGPAAAALPGLLRICPGHPAPGRLAARWFHSRLQAAHRVATGQLRPAQALELLDVTSVRALQAAPPGAREQHAGAALAVMARALGDQP